MNGNSNYKRDVSGLQDIQTNTFYNGTKKQERSSYPNALQGETVIFFHTA